MKTQISLGICLRLLHADSEDSDQTGRTGHFVGFVMLWLIYNYNVLVRFGNGIGSALILATLFRLYLCNSPAVRADNLRFKEDGVRDVLKDVFLPWYNAYRFLMQNVERLERVGTPEKYTVVSNDNLGMFFHFSP